MCIRGVLGVLVGLKGGWFNTVDFGCNRAAHDHAQRHAAHLVATQAARHRHQLGHMHAKQPSACASSRTTMT